MNYIATKSLTFKLTKVSFLSKKTRLSSMSVDGLKGSNSGPFLPKIMDSQMLIKRNNDTNKAYIIRVADAKTVMSAQISQLGSLHMWLVSSMKTSPSKKAWIRRNTVNKLCFFFILPRL